MPKQVRKFGLSKEDILDMNPHIVLNEIHPSQEFRYLLKLLETDLIPEIFNYDRNMKTVTIVDCETTGLDFEKDEIIEFTYFHLNIDADYNLYPYTKPITVYREPSVEITQETIDITGINPNDLKGKVFTNEEMRETFENTDIVVAHNASFDRKFFEKHGLDDKIWICTVEDFDAFEEYGCKIKSLASLMAQCFGYYMNHHESKEDVLACYKIIETHCKDIIINALTKNMSILVDIDYEYKDILKARGYHWNSEVKRWCLTNQLESTINEEIEFLKTECEGKGGYKVTQTNVKERFK